MPTSHDQTHDFYRLDSKLTPRERELQESVSEWVAREFMPCVPKYWEAGDLPRSVARDLGGLGVFGSSIDGFGGESLSSRATGIIMRELERGDSGLRTSHPSRVLSP